MSMRQTPPAKPKPWEVLLLAVAGCTLVFLLAVGGAIYWFVSATERHQPDSETIVAPSEHRVAEESFGRADRSSRKDPDAKSLPGDDLFRDGLIPSVQIKVPLTTLFTLNRKPREYVQVTIHEGTKVYTNVAIHLKGGPGSYRSLFSRPAFTLNFDKFAPGQTFHGLKKLHLNNSVQDSSYLEEKISRELFEAADVPAPRAAHARVTLNSRDLGIYVLVEGINKQFLKRYFTDAKGNIYDGHSGTDVTDDLPVNGGEDSDNSHLRALARAAREPDLDARLAALEKTLDLDRFLSYMAMEMILWHWDGYTMSPNNFRIFHDRAAHRMVFLPQGLDQVLDNPTGRLFPESPNGLVARSVLEIPEARQRYRQRLAELSTNVFRVEAITNRIHQVAAGIQAVLAQTDRNAVASHCEKTLQLCQRIQRRARYLQNQIAPTPALHFTGTGDEAALTNWWSKVDLGEAILDRLNDPAGRTLLHIATENDCTASWRTRTLLDRGHYTFTARMKTRGVLLPDDDPRAGAGLRVSRHRKGQKNSGDNDWMPLSFEFNVDEDRSEIELVCELRAISGEIWFDVDSLRLTRN